MTTRNPLDTKLWSGPEIESLRLAKALTDRFPFQFTSYGTADPAAYVVCVELLTSTDITAWTECSGRVRTWLALFDNAGGIAVDEIPAPAGPKQWGNG